MSPGARGVCTVLLIAGAALSVDPRALAVAWLVLALAAASVGLGGVIVRFALVFIAPIALGALLINGLLHAPVPGDQWWSRFAVAAPAAMALSLRIAVIAAAFQLCFLPLIDGGRLITFLRTWRCTGRALVVTLGGVTLVAELKLRTRQVLESRLAQGLGAVTTWGALRQLPFVLLPLTVYMLDAAANRSDLWARRNLVERLERYRPSEAEPGFGAVSAAALVLCLGWLGVALWFR